MNEESNVGNQNAQEGSATLSGQGGQPSLDLTSLKSELLASLETKLSEAEKRWQSDKDRRIPKVETEVGNLKAQIEQVLTLGKAGYGPEQIEREMLLTQLLDQYKNMQPQEASTPVAAGNIEVQSIVSKAGLDANDAEVMAAIKGLSDPVDVAVKLGELKAKKANQPNPTNAQAPATPGSSAHQASTETDLIAELQKLQTSNPLSKRIDEITTLLGW